MEKRMRWVVIGLLLLPWAAEAWWDTNYGKRTPIVITEASGNAITDYPVMLEFDHEALVVSGPCQKDGDDLRIVAEDSTTEVPRCLDPESAWELSNTQIWFTVTIGASEVDTYWMYYDHSGASAPAWTEESVFTFFDHFTGSALGSHWDGEEGEFGVGNSICSTTTGEQIIWNNEVTVTDCAYEALVRTNSSSSGRGSIYARVDTGDGSLNTTNANGYRLRYRIESQGDIYLQEYPLGQSDSYSAGMNNGNWYRMKETLYGTAIKGFDDGGTERVSFTDGTYTTGVIALCTHTNADFDWDWVLVRDFVGTEPTDSLGTEQELALGVLPGHGGATDASIAGPRFGGIVD